MLQLGGLSEDKATILDLGQRLGGLLQEMQLAVVVDTSALLSELDESFQSDVHVHVKALLEGQEQLADGQMQILSKLDPAEIGRSLCNPHSADRGRAAVDRRQGMIKQERHQKRPI